MTPEEIKKLDEINNALENYYSALNYENNFIPTAVAFSKINFMKNYTNTYDGYVCFTVAATKDNKVEKAIHIVVCGDCGNFDEEGYFIEKVGVLHGFGVMAELESNSNKS